jgi:hypothetical protein
MAITLRAMRTRTCFALAFLIFSAVSSLCFGSTIASSVSQDSLFIGDRVHLGVVLMVPRASQVVPPATENSFGKFAVKEWTSDKAEKKNADSLTFHYIITTYSAENCTIPALDFIVAREGGADTLRTQPVPMRLVLVSSPDTASIKDLKPQQSVGKPSLAWLWIIFALAAGTAAFLFIRKYLPKHGKVLRAPPPKPPYDEAMEAIAALEAKQYIAKGMIREYAFELSEIVKRYIERRFDVKAAEFTTEEMLDWIKTSPLDPDCRKSIEWFFSTTDPVKFAKWLPDNDTVNRFGPSMRSFIEKTRPLPAQPGKKEADSSAAGVKQPAGAGTALAKNGTGRNGSHAS